ncbi:MAG: hypothetical protein V7603_1329 [Micromonosporaceae bacterium]
MDGLLSLVPADERPLVRARARRLAIRAESWSAPVAGELGTSICATMALVVPAIAPRLDDDRAFVLVRYGLWTVLLDDRLNVAEAPRQLARTVRDALTALPAAGFLTLALADIWSDLRRLGGDGAVSRRFAAALRDALRAEVEHLDYARDGYWRGHLMLERHVSLGARHVNYRSFGLALLMLVADQVPAELLDLVDAALVPGAAAVRLANDLRSRERDRDEDRPNALALRTRHGAPVTEADVRRRIEAYAGHHDRLLGRYRGPHGEAVRAVRDSLRLALGLYQVTDLTRGEA